MHWKRRLAICSSHIFVLFNDTTMQYYRCKDLHPVCSPEYLSSALAQVHLRLLITETSGRAVLPTWASWPLPELLGNPILICAPIDSGAKQAFFLAFLGNRWQVLVCAPIDSGNRAGFAPRQTREAQNGGQSVIG